MQATTISVKRASGTPTTTVAITPGCCNNIASTCNIKATTLYSKDREGINPVTDPLKT